ncbi:MAG TPA: DUF899 domain-containing protein [Kofleriaceae bacterium]|jgi:predicted dithiol-disulfide oxidoreductase (DUF899 family)
MPHPIVTRAEWLAARTQLLAKEKELTARADALATERRALPWVRVEKPYAFQSPTGPRTLADLFGDKHQLYIYHFMFGPQAEAGCPSCSLAADHIDRSAPHLAARDLAVAVVSRAPIAKLSAFAARMGWTFPWFSSGIGDFNADFGVTPLGGAALYNYGSEPFRTDDMHGASIFTRGDDGAIYHTYSSFGRGIEPLLGVYHYLDVAPRGRDESALPWPMAWVRHHDRYAP